MEANDPPHHWEPALRSTPVRLVTASTPVLSRDLDQETLTTEQLPWWKLRHKEPSLALSLLGNAKPSPLTVSCSLPSWIYQSRGPRLAAGSWVAQKSCSPVVFDVVFHLIEAHGVAQGKVVGVSLHGGAPVHL